MLLLIEPEQPVRATKMSIGEAIVRRDVERKSLDDLRWKRARKYSIEQVLPAALRRGIKTGRGLIVDEGFVKILLAANYLELNQQAQDELVEQLKDIPHDADAPGYKQVRERKKNIATNAREANQQKLHDAKKARLELLSEPIKPELQAHWEGATQRPVETYDPEDGQPVTKSTATSNS